MNILQVAGLIIASLVSLPAMAYIDPGSGSAIMSAVIGFFVACWLVIKTYWYKIKSIFTAGGADEEAAGKPEGDPLENAEEAEKRAP